MALADIEDLLKASMGLHAASIGSPAIARAVEARSAACQLANPDAYWDRVRGSDVELQLLIEAVVVPETSFFRDRDSFAALSRLVRDEWLPRSRGGVLHLLSVPCSTGEEPYSMAMALLDASIPADRFRIDALDISTRALAYADRAVYGKNSFRGDDLAFRDRHFAATADGYRISDTVRQRVAFQAGNLLAADFLPGVERYDVIFCRNVLIYFDRATQDRTIVVLKRLLTSQGLLFVAPAETALPLDHDFVSINQPQAFAFRRAPAAPVRAPVASPPPAPHPAWVRPPLEPAVAQIVTPVAVPTATPSDELEEVAQLANQGHFTDAAERCAEHLRRHGPSAAGFYLLGLVRDATGNYAEADASYRKALYLDPTHGEAQIHLALLMEKQGNPAGAQVLRNRARRLAQDGKASHE